MRIEAVRVDRVFILFSAASLAFLAFGMAMLASTRVHPEKYGDAPMAEYYLAMACRCPWPRTGVPWSIHTVAAPFRYRVLVPWLAGLLPLSTATSLSLITYASLAVFYVLVLLCCRQLGLSPAAGVCAVALPFVFEPHLVNYYHPFLVEGFGLMVIAVMFYAFTIESFWLFAITGLCGVFAREVTWFLLPVWCARNVKRGIVLTVVASAALLVERAVVWGPPYALPYTVDPMTVLRMHEHNVSNYVRDIRATWGWAFAVCALGVGLIPIRSFRVVWPMALGLLAAALCTSLFATDTARLFGILMPVVVIAAAQLIAMLAVKRQYILLALLCGLVMLQYCVTPNNGLSIDGAALAAAVRPIRLGTAWTLAAAFVLRRELACGISEKLGIGATAMQQVWR